MNSLLGRGSRNTETSQKKTDRQDGFRQPWARCAENRSFRIETGSGAAPGNSTHWLRVTLGPTSQAPATTASDSFLVIKRCALGSERAAPPECSSLRSQLNRLPLEAPPRDPTQEQAPRYSCSPTALATWGQRPGPCSTRQGLPHTRRRRDPQRGSAQ